MNTTCLAQLLGMAKHIALSRNSTQMTDLLHIFTELYNNIDRTFLMLNKFKRKKKFRLIRISFCAVNAKTYTKQTNPCQTEHSLLNQQLGACFFCQNKMCECFFFAFWLLFHSFSEEFVDQNGFFDHVASTFCNTNFSNVSIFSIQFFFHAAKQKPTFIFQQYFGFACATINPLGNPQKYQFIKMKYFMDTILQMKTIQKEKQTKPQNRYIKNVI